MINLSGICFFRCSWILRWSCLVIRLSRCLLYRKIWIFCNIRWIMIIDLARCVRMYGMVLLYILRIRARKLIRQILHLFSINLCYYSPYYYSYCHITKNTSLLSSRLKARSYTQQTHKESVRYKSPTYLYTVSSTPPLIL